jgi:hypothetical protein
MEPTVLTRPPVEPELLNDRLTLWQPMLFCRVKPGCKPPACGQLGAWILLVECPCRGVSEAVVCDAHGRRGDLDALAVDAFRCCRCRADVVVLSVDPV